MPAPNEPPGGAEALSQSEVERLLAQVAEQENSGPVLKPGDDKATPTARDNIQPYDFRHPVFLSASELRRLRIRHEDFIRALAARLSIYMRLEFTLQMLKLETVPYQKFAESLPNPTHLSLFKVEPLRGIGVLDIHPRLGLTMIDRLLGGPAHSISADHDLSEIEMALLDQAVQLILGEWCNHWASVQELRPLLLGHENNGHFLQTAPGDTIMLVLAMEAKIGDCLEQMQVALPCFTLEPLIRKLGNITDDGGQTAALQPIRIGWNRNFDEVPVPVTAIWDDLVMTARDVANLKAGDILPLDARSARRVKLRLAELPKFEGHLGTAGGKWAVAVTGKTKS
ncbi:MAG TPA: FliM/FliN family flagellar motor switch protein [Candidatus Saccharimonadales bacterium]|nr:FliM/FliN family flagellar motor switch protein [Candidatus Saccharimonadales bacterium]